MEILKQHCILSGKFHQLNALNHFLIDEMHAKKLILPLPRRRANNIDINREVSESFYRRILFRGLKEITCFSEFPAAFQSDLDSLLFHQMSSDNCGFELCDIYYGHQSLPEGPLKDELFHAKEFDKNEWILSEGNVLTVDDKNILLRYRDVLIAFMDECIAMVTSIRPTYDMRDMKKERKRFRKVADESQLYNF